MSEMSDRILQHLENKTYLHDIISDVKLILWNKSSYYRMWETLPELEWKNMKIIIPKAQNKTFFVVICPEHFQHCMVWKTLFI